MAGQEIAVNFVANTASWDGGVKAAADTLKANTGRMFDDLRKLDGGFSEIAKEAKATAGALVGTRSGYDQLQQAIKAVAGAQIQASAEFKAAKEAYRQGTLGLEEYKRQQLETRTALALVRSEYQSQVASFRRGASEIVGSSGAQRAGLQQLGFQLQDVAVQFAGGQKAALIFSQQMPQVVGAVQLMSGGTSKFAQFMAGPWGVALGVGSAVVGALAAKFMDFSDASEQARVALGKVQFATSAVSQAQGILGTVMDLQTGKIQNQSQALRDLAQAQLAVARVKAQVDAADARKALQRITDPRTEFSGGLGGGFSIGKSPLGADQKFVSQVLAGVVTPANALGNLEKFQKAGQISPEDFANAASAIANLNVNLENIKVLGDAEKLLAGKPGGNYLLKPKEVREAAKGRSGPSAESLARKAEEQQKEFTDLQASLDMDLLNAKRANVTDAEQIAQYARDQIGIERDKLIADIEAKAGHNKEIEAHKVQLEEQAKQIAAQKLLTVDVQEMHRKAADELDAFVHANDNQKDILRLQESLAVTQEERRKIQLQLLEKERDELRRKANVTINDPNASPTAKLNAQNDLSTLDQKTALQRDYIIQSTRSPLEQYIAENDPAKIGEKVEQLYVDQLESVRQGIDNAISNALGVKDPFLKGLIDLFIQQNLIQPIAQALQSRMGGGGGGGLLGTLFGIGKAVAGSISFGGGGGLLGGTGDANNYLGFLGGGNSNIVQASNGIMVNQGAFAKAFGHADGGLITGPGGPTSDSIQAWLSNGEYVLNAAAVRKWGKSQLDLMNKGITPPRFAAGGFVSKLGDHYRGIAANSDSRAKPVTINLSMIASGNPKADRESAMQAASVLRAKLGRSAKRGY
ncbi:hypothetical protein [Sphingobium estronivorans]|uniref:hypothetical protein n=1 Tax=Sphingobium estronivorans TaxID=1577690 RepID=UPI00123A3F8F|nr:hypothetical protein [Sphingobium estronivorans]